jgi:hypothetical protein
LRHGSGPETTRFVAPLVGSSDFDWAVNQNPA